jgi:hypothetical protein
VRTAALWPPVLDHFYHREQANEGVKRIFSEFARAKAINDLRLGGRAEDDGPFFSPLDDIQQHPSPMLLVLFAFIRPKENF